MLTETNKSNRSTKNGKPDKGRKGGIMNNYTNRTEVKERIKKSEVVKHFDIKSIVFLGRAYNELGDFHSQSYLVSAIQKCLYCNDIARVYEVTLYEEDNKMAFVPMRTEYQDTEWERS